MFTENKYYFCYCNIINKRIANSLAKSEYGERHHIIPRSLGGTNHRSNLVRLSAREHFVCHLLLVKCTTGANQYRMMNAVAKFMQSNKHQTRILTSRQYALCRRYAAACASYFRTGTLRSQSTINKAIQTNIERYGAGSSRINAIITEKQKQKMRAHRANRNTYEAWFKSADPEETRQRHSEWAKQHSNFVTQNPSVTEVGKRRLSVTKSPGTILTPYGSFSCRYDFDLHPTCKLIGFDTVFYMGNKLNGIIKTRAINRAHLPVAWLGKTWQEVGFNIISD